MAFNQQPFPVKRTRHSKFKEFIPRAIELRKTMDLSWRETAEVLGKELGQEIPHNSLFKAAKAWLFRQLELQKWPDVAAASKLGQGAVSPAAGEWPEESAQTVNLPEVKIRKPREK